jgi:hypothetical protein
LSQVEDTYAVGLPTDIGSNGTTGAAACDSITAVDFASSPAHATLSVPTSPLIIAIDDLAAKSLNKSAYKEVHKQLCLYARKLLAFANHFSKQDNGGYPFSKISAVHIKKAVAPTIRDIGVDQDRREGVTTRFRELALAIFAAAVGMSIENILGMRGASQSLEFTVIIAMLIFSALIFLFLKH